MNRYVAAVAVALCLIPSGVFAQSATFTVNAASANVYNSPSTGALVIGQALNGAVLEITRELGSWVKIVWPSARDRVGYVHVSNGAIANGVGVAALKPSSATGSSTPTAMLVSANGADGGSQINGGGLPTVYVAPPTHRVGLGGGIGGTTVETGASARAWTRNRLGVQFAVSRAALTSVASTERVSTLRFTPSVLWAVKDSVGDYLWVRPYVGGGAMFYRSTLTGGSLSAGTSASDSGVGFQTFGGGELTFVSVPKFALSAELGYRWSGAPTFPGFDLNGLGFSVSGHWYVK